VSTAERPLPRRLRKRVAESLNLSLQAVDQCWHAGRVRVITPEFDEPRLVALETLLFEEDQLLLDGAVLARAGPSRPTYALLNKPKHVTSSAREPNGKGDLAPYLRAMPPGCFAVGRLDRDTTGLLLFTNDGDLASAVLRPDHETTKRYWLWLDETLEADDPRLAQLVSGVTHHDALLCAKSARIAAQSEHATELELELTTGKKRQIRLMCRALNLRLVHLHRSRIGSLTDAGLALGAWRLLEEHEVEALWQAAGGRANVRRRKIAAFDRLALEARNAGTPLLCLEQWLEAEARG
jgi:23S rRNA pseudouridine2605 synthase